MKRVVIMCDMCRMDLPPEGIFFVIERGKLPIVLEGSRGCFVVGESLSVDQHFCSITCFLKFWSDCAKGIVAQYNSAFNLKINLN